MDDNETYVFHDWVKFLRIDSSLLRTNNKMGNLPVIGFTLEKKKSSSTGIGFSGNQSGTSI